MLIQFSVENYKSIKDKVTLSMDPANINEHKEFLINGYLNKAVIYGPNGGGKSNLIEAINSLILYMKGFNVESNLSPKQQKNFFSKFKNFKKFKFDEDSIKKPTIFELFFLIKNIEYKYELSVIDNVINYEKLYKKENEKSIRVFERKQKDIIVNAKYRKIIDKAMSISDNITLVAFVNSLFDIDEFKKINFWLSNILTLQSDVNYGLTHTRIIEKFFASVSISKNENINNYTNTRVKNIINSLLPSIVDYYFEDKIVENGLQKVMKTVHKVGDQEYSLELDQESAGTKKIFALSAILAVQLDIGGVLVIDEFDVNLHSKLLREIINMFNDKNINVGGAQLIFTSHDIPTMDSDLFRRDEIWFIAKNKFEASRLYSLIEIKNDGKNIRSDAKYSKQYLEGRYGADPYFNHMRKMEY